MSDWAKQTLARPIHLADEVTKACGQSDRVECQQDLKPRAEKLAALLRQAARSPDLYEKPAERILEDTKHALEKVLALVHKCSHQPLLSRLFSITPAAAFKKHAALLDNSLGDLSWLLRVSHPDPDDLAGYLGLPPIAANEPILGFIWEQVARLNAAPLDQRAEAAAALASLAENDRYRKLIIEEGGVPPLLRLLKENGPHQESAVRVVGLLAGDPESVDAMLLCGACAALTSVLKDGSSMDVQASVAAIVADFATHLPKSQDAFLQLNAVRFLVVHLAFETVEEHSKYSVVPRMHSVVQSTMNATKSSIWTSVASASSASPAPTHSHHPPKAPGKAGTGRGEGVDAATKARMKAMAARALACLCRGNAVVCRSVTESCAMLCFAVLLEKGGEEVRRHSALAIMEIAKVAEKDSDLRHAALKPTSPAARAVIDQLLKVVEKGDELLVPCVVALGYLAKTFRASETRIIPPLVKLLDQREAQLMKEAAIALTKFACTDNFLRETHSKAIIEAGGVRHLIQLVYFEEQELKVPALALLCYIAKAVPDSEELAESNVLNVLEWASKQSQLVQEVTLDELLPATSGVLELYQSRGTSSLLVGNATAAPSYAF